MTESTSADLRGHTSPGFSPRSKVLLVVLAHVRNIPISVLPPGIRRPFARRLRDPECSHRRLAYPQSGACRHEKGTSSSRKSYPPKAERFYRSCCAYSAKSLLATVCPAPGSIENKT